MSVAEMLWLSEGEAYAEIPDPPRQTDLSLDGRINLEDLVLFLAEWMQDLYWP
jgi:hypothetical protein